MKKLAIKKTKSLLNKLLKKCKDSETLSIVKTIKELGGNLDIFKACNQSQECCLLIKKLLLL